MCNGQIVKCPWQPETAYNIIMENPSLGDDCRYATSSSYVIGQRTSTSYTTLATYKTWRPALLLAIVIMYHGGPKYDEEG